MDGHGLGPIFTSRRPRHDYDHLQPNESEEIPMYSYQHNESIGGERKSNKVDGFESDSSLLNHAQQDVADEFESKGVRQPPQSVHAEFDIQHNASPPRFIPRKPIASATYYQMPDQTPPQSKVDALSNQRGSQSIFAIWWCEAVCCLLAIGAAIAMVITVIVYKNKPLPRWPYDISISSLLAIYGLIFRAAGGYVLSEGLGQLKWTRFETPHPLHDLHVYDEASRGPMGCLQLLSNFRGKQFIARLGALLTIALLIIDPFTQQLIKFESCNQPAPDMGSALPRISSYYGHGTRLWTGGTTQEYGMQAATNAGVFTPNGTQVLPDCRTGNCTFGVFHTVGYCHDCADVSAQVIHQRNQRCTAPGYNGNTYKPNDTHPCDIATYPLRPGRNMTITNTSLLDMMGGSDSASEHARFTFLVPPTYNDTINLRAVSCGLEMCIRKVNASVVLGTLYEDVLATYTNWGEADNSVNDTRSMIDLNCLSDADKETLTEAGYRYRASDVFMPYNGSLLSNGTVVAGKKFIRITANRTEMVPNNEALAELPARCIYSVSDAFSMGMQDYLSELFTGNLTNKAMDTSETGSSVLASFYWRNGTLEAFNEAMSNMANSMTSYMRQSGPVEVSVPVNGIAQITTTCVVPQLKWIAYIAVIAGLVLGFFVAMVCRTEFGHGVWRHDFKASALAMICAGLDAETKTQLNAILQTGRKHDLEVVSRGIPVRFVKEEGKFIRHG